MLSSAEWVMVMGAMGIGVVHTLAGPDHYLPFIALSKARSWTTRKTLLITTLCGIGHVGSSFAIGIAALGLGYGVHKLTPIEELRGDIAAWALLSFGLVYAAWGSYRRWKRNHRQQNHVHVTENTDVHSHGVIFHSHEDGTVHSHDHFHTHGHTHRLQEKWGATPWVLFIIFVFGPCEVFIPTYLYPAANGSVMAVAAVTIAFLVTTVGTMNIVVYAITKGIRQLRLGVLETHPHLFAGGILFLSGLAVVLGL